MCCTYHHGSAQFRFEQRINPPHIYYSPSLPLTRRFRALCPEMLFIISLDNTSSSFPVRNGCDLISHLYTGFNFLDAFPLFLTGFKCVARRETIFCLSNRSSYFTILKTELHTSHNSGNVYLPEWNTISFLWIGEFRAKCERVRFSHAILNTFFGQNSNGVDILSQFFCIRKAPFFV
jgi:hypothetical protein